MNSQFTLAVHSLVYMSLDTCPMSSEKLAKSCNVNAVTIRKLTSQLRHAGWIETRMGGNGGSLLAINSSEITLKAVYNLMKDETLLPLHPNEPCGVCPVGRYIQPILTDVFMEMDQLLEIFLGRITIADIAQSVRSSLEKEHDSS